MLRAFCKAPDVSYESYISPPEEIIEEARNGRLFILVDDEDRENEGDLVIPAQMATPDVINFMAKNGRGLICLALTRDRVEKMGLPLMSRDNQSRHTTAFTVSIEARDGVTTGISASDRARTISVAIESPDPRRDLVTPGHVFPLLAREGGVLVRAGHTEAAVDISRLAGLNPAGVICEIMNDDGTMARLPDLVGFAQRHGIKLGTIADLIAYRLRHERVVKRTVEEVITSRYGGEWRMVVFVNTAAYAEHVALVKGDISGPEPLLVRMHQFRFMEDVLGERSGREAELIMGMEMIAEAGRGLVVILREPRATSLSDLLKRRRQEPTFKGWTMREYGVGAQILMDFGVHEMILLSNSKQRIVGLDAYGIHIAEQRPLRPGVGS
ncbi:MAG: 3,4-dihydroxy-2-butanone-4-phosphate synthase [Alphaproteobacteria bacterium]